MQLNTAFSFWPEPPCPLGPQDCDTDLLNLETSSTPWRRAAQENPEAAG